LLFPGDFVSVGDVMFIVVVVPTAIVTVTLISLIPDLPVELNDYGESGPTSIVLDVCSTLTAGLYSLNVHSNTYQT